MKYCVKCVAVLAVLALLLGCEVPEETFSKSVTSVQAGDLADYSGDGSLPDPESPTLAEDVLEAVSPGFVATGQAVEALVEQATQSPPAASLVSMLNSLKKARNQRTIEQDIEIGENTASGTVTINDEPIIVDSTTVGMVDSLNLTFSAETDPPEPPEDMTGTFSGNGELDAAISLEDFDLTDPYECTVSDASLNAAAEAVVDVEMDYEAEEIVVDYNVGAALSAGYTISSDTYVGKYIVTFSYSDKRTITITSLEPEEIMDEFSITATIDVYDNDDILITSQTYTEEELAAFFEDLIPETP
jgi:hypothetical protein